MDQVIDFLRQSYWSTDIRPELVRLGFEKSVVVGSYEIGTGVFLGAARAVSDHARFAYLCDVFVLEPFRGQGIATAMIEHLMNQPELAHVGHWILATKDAHEVYAKLGFEPANERYMKMTLSPERWKDKFEV